MSINRKARLITLACLANVLSYMDRVCIAVAAPQISNDLRLTSIEMGLVFGAFSLAYALLQAPWGMIADWLGARRVVAGSLFSWSLFTGLTGAVWSLSSAITTRFAFGASEAALSPAIASLFSREIVPQFRATAFAIFLSGGRLGGMLSPVVAAFLLRHYRWQSVFWVMAALGIIVAVVWLRGVRQESKPVAARPQYPFRLSLPFTAPFVFLLFMIFCYTLVWQFYATWFPTYLVTRRKLNTIESSVYAGLPFGFGLLANLAGGPLADQLSKRLGVVSGRRWLGCAGLTSSALLLYAGAVWPEPHIGATLMSLAAGTGDLVLAPAWALAVDLGGVRAGATSGLMNAISNLGAFVSPLLVGWLVQTVTWNTVFLVAATAAVASAVFWLGATTSGSAEPSKKHQQTCY